MTLSLWSLAEDEIITHVTNTVADLFNLDHLLIPANILENYRTSKNLLPHRSSTEIQARYAALCVINRAAAIALPLIDLGCTENRLPLVYTTAQRVRAAENFTTHVLNKSCTVARTNSGTEIIDIKGVIFTRTKLDFWNRALTETTTPTGAPPDEFERPDDLKELQINRPEALNVDREANLSFNDRLRVSIFGQLQEQMKHWEDRALRRSFVHVEDAGQRRAFFVKFVGEGVDDHGGPYRAVFQSAVGEEPAGALELLVACPNANSEVGENRDKMMMNPSLLWVPEKLPLFAQLGKLVAMGCRHKVLVPLSFSSLVWKPITGEEVLVEDLESVDVHAKSSLLAVIEEVGGDGNVGEENVELLVQALLNACALPTSTSMLNSIATTGDSAAGRYSAFATAMATALVTGQWSTTTSSESSGEVLSTTKERGAKVCELILQLRTTSHQSGLAHLFKGLAAVVPAELLALFSVDEAERLFCGELDVNIELLKKATVYDEVSPTDKHIQFFWQSVELMTPEERSQLINFCSGRSRLPASMRDFPMRFKLSAPPPRSRTNPDSYLPIAQTCFFSLSLPMFSTQEICLQKLRYAINNAHLMDADFLMRNAEGWQNI